MVGYAGGMAKRMISTKKLLRVDAKDAEFGVGSIPVCPNAIKDQSELFVVTGFEWHC